MSEYLWVILLVLCLPFIVYLCAKLASHAVFREWKRFFGSKHLEKDNGEESQ